MIIDCHEETGSVVEVKLTRRVEYGRHLGLIARESEGKEERWSGGRGEGRVSLGIESNLQQEDRLHMWC